MAAATILAYLLLCLYGASGARINVHTQSVLQSADFAETVDATADADDSGKAASGTNPDCDWSLESSPDYAEYFGNEFSEVDPHWWGTESDRCTRCYSEFMLELLDAEIKTELDCVKGGGNHDSLHRPRFCTWTGKVCQRKDDEEGAKKAKEEVQAKIDALRPSSCALGCHHPANICADVGPLGCVFASPAPRAICGAGCGNELEKSSAEHMLPNKKDEICFFNTAITMLFAGSNDLVPALAKIQGETPGCFPKTREMLRHIVREMRNTAEVGDGYVYLMLDSTRAYCSELLGQELEKVANTKGGQASDVARELILPSLGVSFREVELSLSDPELPSCEGTASLRDCAQKNVDLELKAPPELIILHFRPSDTSSPPNGFRFYDERPLELGSAKYRLFSGTAASKGHNVAWTAHPVNGADDVRFTLYNDIAAQGIVAIKDVEAGLRRLAPGTDEQFSGFRIKLVVFRRL